MVPGYWELLKLFLVRELGAYSLQNTMTPSLGYPLSSPDL